MLDWELVRRAAMAGRGNDVMQCGDTSDLTAVTGAGRERTMDFTLGWDGMGLHSPDVAAKTAGDQVVGLTGRQRSAQGTCVT